MDKQGKTKSQTHFVDICKAWPYCLQALLKKAWGKHQLTTQEAENWRKILFSENPNDPDKAKIQRINHEIHITQWADHGHQTYCMGTEFSSALKEAKGEWLSSAICTGQSVNLQVLFPKALGVTFEDGTPAFGALVAVFGDEGKIGNDKYRGVICSVMGENNQLRIACDANEDGTLRLESVLDWGGRGIALCYRDMLEFVCRCLAYIRSADPDLRHIRPVIPMHASERKLKAFKATNPNLFPVTWVSWDWKRPRVYGIDETTVTGHFRWQRCGKNNYQVKLIWIDEHIRHYGEQDNGIEARDGVGPGVHDNRVAYPATRISVPGSRKVLLQQ